MKSFVSILLAILLAVPLSTSASAQDRRNFWILNNTGRTITNVYVSSHTDTKWGSDVLGRDVLVFGEGSKLVFSGGGSNCMYDFKLVFNDGTSQVYTQGRNLCTLVAVVFNNDTNSALS